MDIGWLLERKEVFPSAAYVVSLIRSTAGPAQLPLQAGHILFDEYRRPLQLDERNGRKETTMRINLKARHA